MEPLNPYENLPDKAFWRLAVAAHNMFDIEGLWDPKFNIRPKAKVVTFGSCFAQHIGKALVKRGFSWMSNEMPPKGLSADNAKKYNYNIFSSRTGNIYTTSLLRQWTEWSLDKKKTSDEVWEKDGRYYDPFRPQIEPDGFGSPDEVLQSRNQTISSFKEGILTADYFVFTLGLTESWFNKKTGVEYPMCPGTAAGVFDSENHIFKNQDYPFILNNLRESMQLMREVNKKLKFILTVSPVPLTATNTGNHVLLATMESKSILRAVAGQLARSRSFIDYFPSYELINAPSFKGVFFEPNQRGVTSFGVDFVMDTFFKSLASKFEKNESIPPRQRKVLKNKKQADQDVVCEEELLNAFGK
ncbi:GSCFA domain-containing protein [Oceanobacter mangrovi]|uniref:GSCFA domain-containing protein n=1 Tax=Oceanobacter mangrovi TaxID=2862510 RepID=UPI001C8F0070|nr:GSCFA domain-containing protein [Oceanobacter mangrovi]